MTVDHLALPVADQHRSRSFYEAYFGFGAGSARRYDDGVLRLCDSGGFALALDRPRSRSSRPRGCTSGSTCATAKRCSPCTTGCDGTASTWSSEPDYANVKCRDPDGYIVEVWWKPQ